MRASILVLAALGACGTQAPPATLPAPAAGPDITEPNQFNHAKRDSLACGYWVDFQAGRVAQPIGISRAQWIETAHFACENVRNRGLAPTLIIDVR